MNNKIDAHMLWVRGSLSNFERMCINSFIIHGYNVNVWTYGDIDNIPSGATIRDAREIALETEIFLNQEGSLAGFGDLFRYRVLHNLGGLWADTDVVALKDASELPENAFLVTEMMENGTIQINGNVVFNPNPEVGNVIDLARAYTERFDKNKIVWAEIGPNLLTAITNSWPGHGFIIAKPIFANPIGYFQIPKVFYTDAELPDRSHFVHLINTIWKRNGVDKNSEFHSDSLMGRLQQKYLP